MESVKKVSHFIGKYMAIIILFVAALCLLKPEAGLWIQTNWINELLMVVMFGMGLTLRLEDFKVIFTKPKDVLIGFIAQFTLMPLIAFAVGKFLGLETGLLVGLILVGTCPGGTASNVMTYLAKGDVALSVGMTSVNTLMAPIMTPTITYLLLRTSVHVDVFAMIMSIIQVVIVPILLGLLINKVLGEKIQKILDLLPILSITAVLLILACVVSHNAELILHTGPSIFLAVILINLLGYAGGYAVGKIFGLSLDKKKTLAIEIGMQNSGLASSLGSSCFAGVAGATVPGAIYSIWHNISGAILASIWCQTP